MPQNMHSENKLIYLRQNLQPLVQVEKLPFSCIFVITGHDNKGQTGGTDYKDVPTAGLTSCSILTLSFNMSQRNLRVLKGFACV